MYTITIWMKCQCQYVTTTASLYIHFINPKILRCNVQYLKYILCETTDECEQF